MALDKVLSIYSYSSSFCIYKLIFLSRNFRFTITKVNKAVRNPAWRSPLLQKNFIQKYPPEKNIFQFMFISKYPNFTVVEFDRMVYEEIKLCGKEITNLYIEDLQLKYLPDDIFLFMPNLKWLDLRYVIFPTFTLHHFYHFKSINDK